MYWVQMKNSACVGCVHLLNFHLEAPFSRYISFLNICTKKIYHFGGLGGRVGQGGRGCQNGWGVWDGQDGRGGQCDLGGQGGQLLKVK